MLGKSSFISTTGVFDICVKLFTVEDGFNTMSIVPITCIVRIAAEDEKKTSRIHLLGGSEALVALPLDQLHQRLRTVDTASGIIDLTRETGNDVEIVKFMQLRHAFNMACSAKNQEYLALRLYAAPYQTPETLSETWVRMLRNTRAEPRHNYETTRSFINLDYVPDAPHLETRIPHSELAAALKKAWEKPGRMLDLRKQTREKGMAIIPGIVTHI